MKIREAFYTEILDFYLRGHTLDGHYLVFYNANVGMNCPEIEKRLSVTLTAEDQVDISIIQYDDFAQALNAFHTIGDIDVGAEIWVNGRRKRKARKL